VRDPGYASRNMGVSNSYIQEVELHKLLDNIQSIDSMQCSTFQIQETRAASIGPAIYPMKASLSSPCRGFG
jgi:hypothetical protein